MTNIRFKVLHLITRLIVGGAQENTLYTGELLNKKNFDVVILSGSQTGREGSLIGRAKRKKLNVILEKNLVREIRPIKDILALFHIYALVRKRKFQIVHTHSSKAGILGRWAAWLAGCPIIIHTIHGWGFHDRQNWVKRNLYIFLEKITLPITDKMIAVTFQDVEKGISAGIGTLKNYSIIRSGIELKRFAEPSVSMKKVRNQLKIPMDAKIVGTVTRLSNQKAPWNFVGSAIHISTMRNDVYFVVVGDGPLRNKIQSMVNKKGLSERFRFTGIRDDVAELMKSFDIFALSSLWEGLPRVIPQAMAGGIPVVASAVNGNAEIIIDYENGRLVPPNNPFALAEAILELIENPKLAEKLSTAALKTAREYDVLKMVKDIELLYMNIIGEKELLYHGIVETNI